LPFSIEVDQKHFLVILKVWGVLEPTEYKAHIIAVKDLGPFDEQYRLLRLPHEHVKIDVPTDQIRSQARLLSKWRWPEQLAFHPKAKRVFVAPTNLAFGLNRLYGAELFQSGVEFTIVRTITEAAAELGMDVADIDVSFPV
jgi:hypothetical protein